MKLASFQLNGETGWGVVGKDGGIVDMRARLQIDLTAALPNLLSPKQSLVAELATAANTAGDIAVADVRFLPPLTNPTKILCIGVNYANRNDEYQDNSALPKFPSVFMRTAESLVGHGTPLVIPLESEQLDYEGEIVIVIGKGGRRIPENDALSHIAGLSIANEGTVRDWCRHGKFNVTQGKNFAASGGIGPWLVTMDDIADVRRLSLKTYVNDELRQNDTTANLLFPFSYLIHYLSLFMPLHPGDIILTGTPLGAGARFQPPRYLRAGDTVRVEVEGIGALSNPVTGEADTATQ